MAHNNDLFEVTFPNGIPGFPEARRFSLARLSDDPANPYSVLLSLDELGPRMILADPNAFFPDFAVDIDDDVVRLLDIESPEEVLLLISVRKGRDEAGATANLLGPFVINLRTRIAAQISQVGDLSLLQVPLVAVQAV